MNVHVVFDDELDRDIIDQMPSWAKGAWVRDRLRQALSNESLLSEQKIISVLEKYLEQKSITLSDLMKPVETNDSTLNNASTGTNDKSKSDHETQTPFSFSGSSQHKTSTWRMPE